VNAQLSDSDLLTFLRTRLPVKDWGDARLRPLPVAYTCRFWRLDVPGRSYVIKEFFPESEDNPLFPTLPAQEADALVVLARHDLSPELELFGTSPVDTPLLVYGYPSPQDNEIDVAEVAELIGRFAALSEPIQGHQTFPAGYHEVIARGDEMLALIPDSRKAANLKRLRPSDSFVSKGKVERSLVHRSLCLGTIQATGNGARLIDWQFAGLGDPVEDIACFVSPGLATLYGLHPLVAHAEELFLESYPDSSIVDRFKEERTGYHWCFAAYCLFRHETLMHTNAPAARAYGRALEEEVDLLLRLR